MEGDKAAEISDGFHKVDLSNHQQGPKAYMANTSMQDAAPPRAANPQCRLQSADETSPSWSLQQKEEHLERVDVVVEKAAGSDQTQTPGLLQNQ